MVRKIARWADNFIKPEEEQEEQAPKERPGVCPTCNNGTFTLAIHKSYLLRCCKTCSEVYNTDTHEIIRKGDMKDENCN